MMNCHYCNKEMEQGVIQSPQELSCNRKKHLMAISELNELCEITISYWRLLCKRKVK